MSEIEEMGGRSMAERFADRAVESKHIKPELRQIVRKEVEGRQLRKKTPEERAGGRQAAVAEGLASREGQPNGTRCRVCGEGKDGRARSGDGDGQMGQGETG